MEKPVKTHKDLRIWKSAINMVEEIYKLTDQIPKHELYGLTSQTAPAVGSGLDY
jgi:four helix bundle protein